MRLSLFALALLPLPAFADTLMTAAEFDAFVTGRVMDYTQSGAVWGTEKYMPNRRVLWALTDAECREGIWYDKGDQICFVYEDPDDPQCWLFYKTDTGVSVRFVGDAVGSEMSIVTESPGPLGCPAPGLGV